VYYRGMMGVRGFVFVEWWRLVAFDLPDCGLKLMDSGFDVLDGGGYLLLQGAGVGAYVMEVSACVPVDEGAIALACVDGDGDGVLLAIDEKSITHRCGSFGI
jgi:hypothetical protein